MNDRRTLLAPASGIAVYCWSRTALAAGGGGGQEKLEVLLLLVGIVGLAYLVAHLALERIAERFGIVTGVEYIVLGTVIFQLVVTSVFPPASGTSALDKAHTLVEQLRPVLVLGTGSLGLMLGLHLDFRHKTFSGTSALRSGAIISLATLATVVLMPAAATWYLYSAARVSQIMPALLCAGAIALVAADAPIRSMISFLGAKGPATRVATQTARICSSFAVVVFGLIFCFDNTAPFVVEGWYAWLQWLGIHLVIGGVLGLVFGTYLRRDLPDDQLLTVVIGMVVFTSGIAYGLHLSPIFVNFISGIVFINTCRQGGHVRSMLSSIKYPLYIVLFIFTGAHLDLSVPFWAYALAGPYLALRLAGRRIGDFALKIFPIAGEGRLPGMGRVLLAPGGLSAAMAVDFLMVYTDRYSDGAGPFFGTTHDIAAIYTGLVTAIVISEIVAYVLIRAWLIDTADVSPARLRHDQARESSEDRS